MSAFEVVETDLTQLADGESILGLWTPKANVTDLSFDVKGSASSTPNGTVWKVNLPSDLSHAQAELQTAEVQLQTARSAMDNAKERLQTTMQEQTQLDEFSFSSSTGVPTTLEEELSFALTKIRGVEHNSATNQASEWQKASVQFQQQLDQLMRSMLYSAWVETTLGSALIARTSISWAGDVTAIWSPDTGFAQMNLHQRSVQLATQSRSTLIRVVGLVIEGLVQVSKLSNPITAVLALPSIWRYVNRVIELRVGEKNYGK